MKQRLGGHTKRIIQSFKNIVSKKVTKHTNDYNSQQAATTNLERNENLVSRVTTSSYSKCPVFKESQGMQRNKVKHVHTQKLIETIPEDAQILDILDKDFKSTV